MISILVICAVLSIGNAQFNLPIPVPTLPPVPVTAPIPLPSVPVPVPGVDICSVLTLAPSVLGADLIKGACSMAKNWLTGFQAITSPQQYRNILSDNQKAYWDNVTKCDSVQCICDYWPKCRALGVNIAQLQAGNTTGVPKDIDVANVTARYGRVTRKDIRAMTDADRHRFFYAMNRLKFDKIDGWSKYDILTGYHAFIPFVPTAHFSAGLLPFHRELLKNLEVALRFEHPLATFPMWDTTFDSEMPNPHDSVMWTADLMGSGSGNVTDGPFGVWQGPDPNKAFPGVLYQGGISRGIGGPQKGALFTTEHVKVIMGKPNIDGWVFCHDPFFDTVHAGVHIYVGGLMADPATSPGDPLFYLFHTYIDYLWEQWRQKNQNRKQRESDYASACPYNPWDNPDGQLLPFNPKVKDAYSNKYTDEFYVYQEEASCANSCHNSTYLVCIPKKGVCMSKVKEGGDCSGLDGLTDNPCFKSTCKGGKCTA